MIRLNLASGTNILRGDGWLNLDIVAWPGAVAPPDIIWDARTDVIPFPDRTVDEVYAGYLLLHLAPNFHDFVMREISRALIPGGRLVVGEVDFSIVMPRWLANPEDVRLSELIWGEQGIPAHGLDYADYDKHCWGFTAEKLRHVLERHGFESINRIAIHHPDVFWELTLECRKCHTSP